MEDTELFNILEDDSGFIKNNNYNVVEMTDKKVVVKADVNETSLNPYGFMHGGFIFGLGDTAMGILASTKGEKAVTISANISYLKPAVGKYLIAKAEFERCGKKVSHLKTDIYNQKEEKVAVLPGSFYYID